MVSKARAQGTDGVSPVVMTPKGTPPIDVLGLHIAHWTDEYSRGRVIVKRRAARVLLGTTLITGIIAVLGSTSALLAGDNLPVQIIGVATTALSALSAVLVAWDEHFRHRDLWAQRSKVLNQLGTLQLDYELARESPSPDIASMTERLDQILETALKSWLQIQGRG